jgi:hypothetical protein
MEEMFAQIFMSGARRLILHVRVGHQKNGLMGTVM